MHSFIIGHSPCHITLLQISMNSQSAVLWLVTNPVCESIQKVFRRMCFFVIGPLPLSVHLSGMFRQRCCRLFFYCVTAWELKIHISAGHLLLVAVFVTCVTPQSGIPSALPPSLSLSVTNKVTAVYEPPQGECAQVDLRIHLPHCLTALLLLQPCRCLWIREATDSQSRQSTGIY